MFYGEYKRHLDEKGRVMVPAELRSLIPESIYITYGFDQCLMILLPVTYRQILEMIDKRSVYDPLARNLRRTFYGKSRLQTIDASTRIRIPAELLEGKNIQTGSDIMLVGNGAYIEVWSMDEWKKNNLLLANAEFTQERFSNFDLVLDNPIPPNFNPSQLTE